MTPACGHCATVHARYLVACNGCTWLPNEPDWPGTSRTCILILIRFGLPKPDHRIFEAHPILNLQMLHYLSHGNVAVRPDRLYGDDVGSRR